MTFEHLRPVILLNIFWSCQAESLNIDIAVVVGQLPGTQSAIWLWRSVAVSRKRLGGRSLARSCSIMFYPCDCFTPLHATSRLPNRKALMPWPRFAAATQLPTVWDCTQGTAFAAYFDVAFVPQPNGVMQRNFLASLQNRLTSVQSDSVTGQN